MSTNPNNAVGTNAAYDGRTSVKAFNDNIGAYSSGILSGWACSPNTGMTVSLGGDGTTRDIAIAEDVAGNKTTINNISEAPISVTMSAAPSTNSRIDLIVAYVDNPPQGSATSIDNPGACGLITVSGTAAANPVAPNESAIRTAITADGASGSTAYYVILAQITIAAGTTDIVAGNISAGSAAGIGAQNIDWTNFTMPTSSVTQLAFGYGYKVTLYRVGNIIMLRSWNSFTANIVTGQSLSEKVPLGYRPVNTTTPSKFFADGSTRWVTWEIHNDGSMIIHGDVHANDAVLAYAVWPTNDPFPA